MTARADDERLEAELAGDGTAAQMRIGWDVMGMLAGAFVPLLQGGEDIC